MTILDILAPASRRADDDPQPRRARRLPALTASKTSPRRAYITPRTYAPFWHSPMVMLAAGLAEAHRQATITSTEHHAALRAMNAAARREALR